MVGKRLQEWDVFTRLERGDDLKFIGSLWAVDEDMAKYYATSLYDERNWFEMKLVPKNTWVPVMGPRAN